MRPVRELFESSLGIGIGPIYLITYILEAFINNTNTLVL